MTASEPGGYQPRIGADIRLWQRLIQLSFVMRCAGVALPIVCPVAAACDLILVIAGVRLSIVIQTGRVLTFLSFGQLQPHQVGRRRFLKILVLVYIELSLAESLRTQCLTHIPSPSGRSKSPQPALALCCTACARGARKRCNRNAPA